MPITAIRLVFFNSIESDLELYGENAQILALEQLDCRRRTYVLIENFVCRSSKTRGGRRAIQERWFTVI